MQTNTCLASDSRQSSARVLVVDDEAAIRDLLSDWLSGVGYECTSAANAAEALSAIERDQADVALLDLRMPGESGVWLARRLREHQDDMALIMVTGAQSFDAAVEGMRIGVLDYLLKPFTRADLLSAVDRAVKWRLAALHIRAERKRLEDEIEQRSLQLSDAFAALEVMSAGALEALLVTLDTRNPEACRHARRVAALAVTLGEAMGLRGAALADLERGALLHDIGKIAMPDSLIHKPGPLDEDEIAIIRTHPQIGHDILAAVPCLRVAALVVLASHEWFDGSGYPNGLAGEQIPLGARITGVADAFDALTRSRVYRDPVSVERACAELARGAGTQFDPAVVHPWIRIADSLDLRSARDRGRPATGRPHAYEA